MHLTPAALLRPLRVLVVCLTLLGLLIQPVLALAHEQHGALHLLSAGNANGEHGQAPEMVAAEGTTLGALEGLLHAFDCCLHATAVPAPAVALKMPAPDTHVGDPGHPVLLPAPIERLLRPPIAA